MSLRVTSISVRPTTILFFWIIIITILQTIPPIRAFTTVLHPHRRVIVVGSSFLSTQRHHHHHHHHRTPFLPSSNKKNKKNSGWASKSTSRSLSSSSSSSEQAEIGTSSSTTDAATMTTIPTTTATTETTDSFLYLEEVESEASLAFATDANKKCLDQLGDPTVSDTYTRVLKVLESNDRIPYASKMGCDTETGKEDVVFNFWKDSTNPKGLWRKCSLKNYVDSATPEDWHTVLDIDALAEQDGISWVYKGSRTLPRKRDAESPHHGAVVTRALLQLSRGGSDAIHIKEFDLLTERFVPDEEHPFHLPEAKTRAAYKSRNVLLVGTDTGPGSLTDSGYPRQVREWVRGVTKDIKDAPVIFEGESSDVSVSCYIDDNRHYQGPIYEVRSRSMTFYTSKYWVREIQPDHLLAPHERQENVQEPGDFVELDIQEDADVNFLGKLMTITLRSDWEITSSTTGTSTTYKQGSVLYCPAKQFLTEGKEAVTFQVLFEPTDRTAYEYYTCTKNYLILATMDNVKPKLDFYKIVEQGSALKYVGGDVEAQARSCSVSPVDPYESDDFWFTVDGYTQPSTLYLANAAKVEDEVVATTESSDETAPDHYITQKVKSLPAQYDATDLNVEQKTATSLDGTLVPYFIITKKDTVLNGKTPTLVYGYGGFEISLGPKYIATSGIAWLERGGAYVEACIRGGGEFGPSWHQAALKDKRNKAYEDFIAVGEDLCNTGLCTRGKTLAARGGSNGGLLMGNMYLQGKDLFAAIHCAVPLLDMKRFHLLLAGASWMAEYGNPDTSDWDDYLHKYSPYHNIDPTTVQYPPMLITTSTRDDRVHPAHARKMVAKLWDTNPAWPVYYYENMEGGHGGAADAKQSAFMTTLAYDFMFSTLTKNAETL